MHSLRFFAKRTVQSWLFLYLLIMLQATCSSAEELSFDGSWQFASSHSGNKEDADSFTQRYSLGWNPRVTRAIIFDTNMNYSRSETSNGSNRESFSPTGNLQVANDLFLAKLSGEMNSSKNSKSYDQLNRSWEAVLASNWDYQYWPSLSYHLGQNWLGDSAQVHVTDNSRQFSEFVTEWQAKDLKTYYSYYTQLRDDQVQQSSYDEEKHFGRGEYTSSFWDNRLSINLSGQLTQSTTQFTATDSSGTDIEIRVGASQAFAGIDPTPLTGSLPSVPALIDGSKTNTSFTINLHEVAQFGLKTDLKKVDKLYIYTGPLDPLFLSQTSSLSWDLYSSENGTNWQRETINPATTYDRTNYRYKVNTGGLQRIYLKLVVTHWPTSLTVPVTEVEAYRTQKNTGTSVAENEDYTRRLSDVNLRYSLTSESNLNYSLVWDDSDYSTGNDNRRIFQTGGFRWGLSDYFSPSVTINNTSIINSDVSDTNQRSYALNVKSLVLPTLETIFGIARNENSTDGINQLSNNAINMHMTAALYPNLDSALDINKSFITKEETGSSDTNLGFRWTLTARPRSSLLVDYIVDYGNSDISNIALNSASTSGERHTLNVNWRPSDLFSILANGSKGYGEQWDGYERYLFDTNISLLRTAKIQIVAGYKLNSTEDETINSFHGDWSWNISEFFMLQTRTSYLISENDSWYFSVRLSTRF